MKNPIITVIILILAFISSVCANNNKGLYNLYVRGVDGNYTLVYNIDFYSGNCMPYNQETCAYLQIRYDHTLPVTLTQAQVNNLSNPILGPITLEPILDLSNQTIKGYYVTE